MSLLFWIPNYDVSSDTTKNANNANTANSNGNANDLTVEKLKLNGESVGTADGGGSPTSSRGSQRGVKGDYSPGNIGHDVPEAPEGDHQAICTR